MRLPMKSDSQSAADRFDPSKFIDEEKAIQLIRYAKAQGINYFDTAYPYHGGKSEPLLGKAVQDCREEILIATKLPAWMVKGSDDFDRFLNEQRIGEANLDKNERLGSPPLLGQDTQGRSGSLCRFFFSRRRQVI
jgi:predicted aldo/keto reductase-like oxidoreductase